MTLFTHRVVYSNIILDRQRRFVSALTECGLRIFNEARMAEGHEVATCARCAELDREDAAMFQQLGIPTLPVSKRA